MLVPCGPAGPPAPVNSGVRPLQINALAAIWPSIFCTLVKLGRVHEKRSCAAPPGLLSQLTLAVCPQGSRRTLQWRQSAIRHRLGWLSVLRRPASGFAPWQATAHASRSHGLRRRCLASSPTPVTVVASLLAPQQTFRSAHAFEHPVQTRRSVPQHVWASNTASA